MRNASTAVIVLFLLCSSMAGRAQVDSLYSGIFNNISFGELIRLIEKKEVVSIYFDYEKLNSLPVSLTAVNLDKIELIRQALKGTEWFVTIDKDQSIYITYGKPVQIEFSRVRIGTAISKKTAPDLSVISEENRLITIGHNADNNVGSKVVLSGYIRSSESAEGLIGAEVYTEGNSTVVFTNEYGYYSLVLPRGRHLIKIKSAGMEPTQRQIQLNQAGSLDIGMRDAILNLKAVIVTAEKSSNTRSIQVGTNRLSLQSIKQVPVAFGETDVLKVILALPGVTSVGEAANGFNVRGGSADQNLILLGDATVFNPTHLFGFFSAFHPDIVKQVELYKASIPEKFGGRLSSVLDVTLQDGNAKKWTGSAGIGPLTSSISLGGPIKKEKATLSFGGRTSYSNWILKQLPEKEYRNSRASFYDLNLRFSFTLDKKNTLYINAYKSHDSFQFNKDTSFQHGNRNINIKWKHNFSSRFTGVLTTGMDDYAYQVKSDNNDVNAFRLNYNINQLFIRSDFNWVANERHQLNAGIQSTFYKLEPGKYQPEGNTSLVIPKLLEKERALESAIYLGDQFRVSSNFSISAGLRWNIYHFLGPRTVFQYEPGIPRDTSTIIDTISKLNAGSIKKWAAPEIRLNMRYMLDENSSIKWSFTTTRQFIHMLSNTVTLSPTDIWKLSDQNIRPQEGMQMSAGYYRSFSNNKWEASIEVYFKRIEHFLDFKSGARLLMNEHVETDLINTKGKAYGIELLVKRAEGRLNGWFSYTYSRTFLKQDDLLAGESINRGRYYPANFDRPHNLNLIVNYRFSHRLSLSGNLVFTSGRPITLPVAIFNQGGTTGLLYSERNEYRIPNYFRSDISFTIDGNHKVHQRFHNSWSVGAYNLSARDNPYSVYYVQEAGKINGYQLSIFGTIIPFVSYKIKF